MKHNIVIPSWELVNKWGVLKKFNFLPSLISTLYLSVIVFYQISYTYIIFFHKKDEFFSLALNFIHQWYFLEVLWIILLWLIFYLMLSPIAEAWVICLIDWISKNDETKNKVWHGISQGLLNFLPLFEYHNFMWLFKLLSIVTFYFLLLRVFWMDYAVLISIIMFVYLMFAMLINILFAYTKFFIIFEKKHVFEAISLSTTMTLNNMDVTWRIYYTLLLVYVRLFLTVVMFTVFPIILSAIFAYITSQFFLVLWVSLVAFFFLIFIILISHVNSVLEIFVEALWYNAYVENMKTFEMPKEKK